MSVLETLREVLGQIARFRLPATLLVAALLVDVAYQTLLPLCLKFGDPDKEAGGPVTLTNSTMYEVAWRWPLSRTFFLSLGAEYEDRKDSYTRTSGLVGFEWRF